MRKHIRMRNTGVMPRLEEATLGGMQRSQKKKKLQTRASSRNFTEPPSMILNEHPGQGDGTVTHRAGPNGSVPN